MALFKKKSKVIDWSEGYRTREKKETKRKKEENSSELGYLGDMANGSSTSENISWDNDSSGNENSGYANYSETNPPEKKQKLAKRLLEMTDRIEDLSNQIYHLKQRVELLEKKLKISFG